MADDDLDDLVDATADTDAIEAKPDNGHRHVGGNTSHLAVHERERWVNLTARHAEHIRRLAQQVVKLGGNPVVEPPPAEVVIGTARDTSQIAHLKAELRIAQSAIDEHERQKAVLRIQINQMTAQLEQLRKDR